MPGRFVAYREQDQALLFDTEKICYGLVKSGYLQLVEWWPQKFLKSAQLDSTWGGNWADDPNPRQPIFGISLPYWRSPVVFLVGDGSQCGEKIVGGVKTILFVGASTNTKAFVFDLMYDAGPINGVKCFKENPWELTFNSGQAPLNIIMSVTPPPYGGPVTGPEGNNAYQGGYRSVEGTNGGATYFQIKSKVDVPIGAGEFAACLAFSRSCGCIQGRNDGADGSIVGAQEGACGYSGGVRFMFTVSAATTSAIYGNSYSAWIDMPTLRPTALVIRTAGLKFPHN